MSHGRFEDLSGRRYGRLTVLSFAGIVTGQMSSWNCQCDCGKRKIIRISNLSNGHTKSCGCLSIETTRKNATTHGHTSNGKQSREFAIWSGAKQRCFDKNCASYPRYGAIGIIMCKEWRDSFEAFYKYMGKCPDGYSIDRWPNNKGNYEPGNVRWATEFQQRTNKRNNHLVCFNGKTLTCVEWDILQGFPRGAMRGRMCRKWSAEKAITTPVKRRK